MLTAFVHFVFRCEGQSVDSSAPLATNDSDDDISDDETAGVRCEEVFSRCVDLKRRFHFVYCGLFTNPLSQVCS